jgi:hypothetical protein
MEFAALPGDGWLLEGPLKPVVTILMGMVRPGEIILIRTNGRSERNGDNRRRNRNNNNNEQPEPTSEPTHRHTHTLLTNLSSKYQIIAVHKLMFLIH